MKKMLAEMDALNASENCGGIMTNKDLRIENIRDCIFRDREGNVVLKLDRVKSIEISAAYSALELPNFKCNFDAYDIDFFRGLG